MIDSDGAGSFQSGYTHETTCCRSEVCLSPSSSTPPANVALMVGIYSESDWPDPEDEKEVYRRYIGNAAQPERSKTLADRPPGIE